VWFEMFGLLSSLYATLAQGDVICFMPRGISINNIFWRHELPVLRRLQQRGIVDNIYVYGLNNDGDFQAPAEVAAGGKSKVQRARWYSKCVALTSPGVKMSHRLADGSWTTLGATADVFVKWLMSNVVNKRSYLTLYRYRLATNIWSKLIEVDANLFTIEMWRPAKPDKRKHFVIAGYTMDNAVKRYSAIEKFLFANYDNWDALPKEPKYLLYINDAFVQMSKSSGEIVAMKLKQEDSASWRYAPALATELQKNMSSGDAKKLLKPKSSELQKINDAVGKIRLAVSGNDAGGAVNVSQLREFWESKNIVS
jgi:hypothetical protein